MVSRLNHLSSKNSILSAFDPKRDIDFSLRLERYVQKSFSTIMKPGSGYGSADNHSSQKSIFKKRAEYRYQDLLDQFKNCKDIDQIYDVVFDKLCNEGVCSQDMDAQERRMAVVIFFQSNPDLLIEASKY